MKQPFLLLSLFVSLSICFSCEETQQAIDSPSEEEIIQENLEEEPPVEDIQSSNVSAAPVRFIATMRNLERVNDYIKQSYRERISAMGETVSTKTQYALLVETAVKIELLSEEFHNYISELKTLIAEESDGVYTQYDNEALEDETLIGFPKDRQNKEVIEQVFITGKYGGVNTQEQHGPVLHQQLKRLREDYLRTVEELWDNGGVKGTIFASPYKREQFTQQVEGDVLVAENMTSNASFWVRTNFYGETVEGVYLLLTEYQNQVNLSTAAIINRIANQMGKLELSYDKFDVFAQSAKPYVLLGETYEAEIALGAYSSQARFSVSVDGRPLKIEDGRAKFSARGSSMGEQTYKAKISVQNPLTGETESFTKSFKYEVGQPAVSVIPEKQNVLYIGTDNVVTVMAAGLPTSALSVSVEGGTLRKQSSTNYNIHVTRPGEVTVLVKNIKRNRSYPFTFIAKRLPNPMIKLGEHVDGLIASSAMKEQEGLKAVLEDFDYEARCQVQSYKLYYTRKRQDPVEVIGTGGRFAGKAASVIKQAKPGDQYAFTNVKARCPGDKAARRVNGLSFKIK